MIYFKDYKTFLESINSGKKYININNIDDNADYYQIPFKIFDEGICIPNQDGYVLCFNNKFYYDFITDIEIQNCLSLDLTDINIEKDWADQTKSIFANEDIDTHTLRIAKLVQEMMKNLQIKPVSLFFDDRCFKYSIPNYIEDGNHRIRALKYLKYDYFPAYVYGDHSEFLIEYLKVNKYF